MYFLKLKINRNSWHSPVSINETSVNVVGPLDSSDWLQAHATGLKGHDVDQPVLEFVTGQTGTDESGRVCFSVGQFLS